MKRSWRVAVRGLVCGAWVTLASLAGCGTTSHEHGRSWTIAGTPKMYAALGTVSVRVDDDDNHIVDLVLEHLPPAYQTFAGTSVYVLWLVPKGGNPRSVGIINVNAQRSARLTITTPYEDFDVVVTAEVPGNPPEPSANRAFVATIDASVS